MRIFHGDYEIEFEIYEDGEDEARGKFLGYMGGVDAFDAKTRWVEGHRVPPEKYDKIYALFPKTEWK